jgi:hypothetical protein
LRTDFIRIKQLLISIYFKIYLIMPVFLHFTGTFPYPAGTANVFEVLRNSLQDMETRNATEMEIKTGVGKRPYWFLKQAAPPYSAFVVGATDMYERQYMSLSPDQIAVRLARGRKELGFPQIGETLKIVPKGTGEVITVFVSQLDLPSRSNPRTAIMEVRYM